jgi:formate hydrogenlyase subunit 3/multisubunit Na+/H+ antiporter MnhD subunit
VISIVVVALPFLAVGLYELERSERATRWIMAALGLLALLGGAVFVTGADQTALAGLLAVGDVASLHPAACVGVVTSVLVAVGALAVAQEQSRPTSFFQSLLAGLGGVTLAVTLGGNPVAMALALAFAVAALIGSVLGCSSTETMIRTGRRYLTWGTLAASALIVSGLLERLYARQPGPGILAAVAGLFVVGVGVLANVLPLSLWLPGLADESPLAAGAVAGLLTSGLVTIVAVALAGDPWLLAAASTQRALGAVGGIGGLLGVFLALGERNPTRVFAYLVSASGGFFLSMLPISPRGDSASVIWFLAAQAMAAGLGFTCLAAAEGKLGSLLVRRPAAAIGLWVATLSLIGFPLTAGFVGRASVAAVLASQYPVYLLVAALTSAIGGIAATRSFRVVFQPSAVPREPLLTFDLFAVGFSVLLIAAGLLPGPILALLR